MKLADLSPARLDWLKDCLYDSLIEKHEGPWDWGGYLLDREDREDHEDHENHENHEDHENHENHEDHAEFLVLDGHEVLLPVPADHNPYISVLHGAVSADGQFVTLWLKDMYLSSLYPEYDYTEKDAWFWAGHLAVCQRAPDADWYVAVFYHEMYLQSSDSSPARAILLPPWPKPDTVTPAI